MHSVTASAQGLRERRATRTVHDLSSAARRLTAEHGLSGFTVEQLCEQVGVSRRTFFNYFGSKEDAVLGRSLRWADDDAVETFLAGAGRGRRRGHEVSPTLLDDLAALHVFRLETLDISREDAAQVRAVLDREPRLLSRLLELSQLDEAADAALVARREGWAVDDVRASTAVHVVMALVRVSAWEFLEFEPDGALGTTFADVVAGRLAAARTLLGT